jgi:cellulose synthase operon protein C
MRRLNVKLSVSLIVGLLVMVAGVHVIHGIQIDKNAGVLLKEAQRAESEGDKGLRRAVKKYSQYLKHRPDDVPAQERFALLAADLADAPGSNQDDMRLAYRALDVAAKHPELVEVRRRIIDYYIRLGRYVDATEYLEKLRAAAQDNGTREPGLDVKYARCQVVLGHHEKALAVLNELVGFDKKTKTFDADLAVAPWEIDAYMALSEVLRRRLDDADLADDVMRQMVVANPDSSDAYLRLGRYEIRQGRGQDAIAAFDRALELAPEDPDVTLEVVDIAITRREFDRARPLIEAGVKNHPEMAEMYRAMGALTLSEGKAAAEENADNQVVLDSIDGAIKHVMTGLEHSPESPTLIMFLVDLEMMKSDFEGVKAAIERMRVAHLPQEFILYYEAELDVRQRKWPSAAGKLERLRPLMARWPDRVMMIDLNLGQCYESLAQPDRQAEAYRRVLDFDPNSLIARLGHSRANLALGKKKEGMEELKKVDREVRARKIDAPQVRANMLQLRISEEMQKPEDKRDWEQVDALVKEMIDDGKMDEVKKTLVQGEMCSLKGDVEGAAALIGPLVKEHPKEVRAWLAWFGVKERLAIESRKTKEKQTPEEQAKSQHDAVEEALAQVAEAEEAAGDRAAFRVLRAAALARLGEEEGKPRLAELEQGIENFSPEDQATIWEGLGNAYQRLKDYENVQRCFKKLVDSKPDDLYPWENMFDLATTYQDDRGATEAADQIKRIAGAGSASYKYCIASQLIGKVIAAVSRKEVEPVREQKRLDEARKLVEEMRRARPEWHQSYRLEGEIDDILNRPDAAIANYQRALELGSKNANTARRVVVLLYQRGRMGEVQAAMKYIGRSSSNPLLEKIDVESKFATGDREAALQLAKDSVAAKPDDAAGHLWLGKLLDADKHLDEAEQEYRAALEQQPESSQLWFMLINNLATAKREAEAAEQSDKAAEKKAEAVEAIANAKKSVPEKEQSSLLAQCYEAIGEIDQAEECYLAVMKENPGNLNVFRNLAEFYFRHNMIDKAREQVELILASKQDDATSAANRAWARRSLAGILAQKGDFADVQKAIQLVQQNTSNDGKLIVSDVQFIALILANRPDPESHQQAIKLYEQLVNLQAAGPQERLTLARLYNREGNWEKARDQMYSLLGRMPKDPVILANWIEMQLEHNETQTLDKWFDKLEEAAPNHGGTVQLKVRWLAQQQKSDEAAAYLNGLVADVMDSTEPLKPEQTLMLGRIASMLEELKDYTDAEKCMRRSYENDRTQVLPLGLFLGRRGKLDDAFALFDKAREEEFGTAAGSKGKQFKKGGDEANAEANGKEDPSTKPSQQAVPTVFVAAVQTLRENPGDAAAPQHKLLEQWLTAAIDARPNSAPLKLLLVDLKDIEGRFGESIKLYRDLLAGPELNNRQRAVVQNNLAFLLVTRGTKKDLPEARTLIDAAVDHFGPVHGVLDTRGLVRLAEGDAKRALEDFKVAVAEAPTASNFFHLAMAEDKMGNAAAASEAITKADELKLDVTSLSPTEERDYKRLHKGPAKPEKG